MFQNAIPLSARCSIKHFPSDFTAEAGNTNGLTVAVFSTTLLSGAFLLVSQYADR